jgi:hypothetical protein
MYYLTEEGRKFLNETPIVGDPGTPEAGKPVKTTLNPTFVDRLQSSRKRQHNPKYRKALAAAEVTRHRLERGKENVPETLANKLVTQAYWSAGQKGRSGRRPPTLPGMHNAPGPQTILVRRGSQQSSA